MIGKTISQYTIVSKIGAGGMGEVFLARDTKLGRDVALKFLPDNLRRDEQARARLLREAQAASRLTHPNIVALHNIEEADGHDFIVMEYVRGRSLKDVATNDLGLDKALAIGRQVAVALAAAHEHGVVHRDIKADNILLTDDGHVKVLDFGLAKFEGAEQLTETSSTVGTVAYMSPEQAAGRDLDHRSDIFSLGVLLYQLVAGRLPFAGDHRAAILYAITNIDPEPLARYRANVPAELQRIVTKCLSKAPEARYQSAADLATDLAALGGASTTSVQPVASPPGGRRGVWVGLVAVAIVAIAAVGIFIGRQGGDSSAPPAGKDRIRIAVLPFENLGAAEDEYFADGLTEEITARLASVGKIGVIARTSVLRYKGSDTPIREIGAALDVEYVLEGTVRWQKGSAARVRVTPQLIRTADEEHVWANVYDEPIDAVFDVQTDIAQHVTEQLGLTLLPQEAAAVEERLTENLEAYDRYLQANAYMRKNIEYDASRRLLLDAIRLDPAFVAAYAALSINHSDVYWFEGRSEEDRRRSKEYADKAHDIAPNSYRVQLALGMYYYHCELDYERALVHLQRANELQPGSSAIRGAIGFVARRQGQWELCLRQMKEALDLDPEYYLMYLEVGETLTDMGRYEEAIPYLHKAHTIHPLDTGSYEWEALVHLLWRGDVEAARAAFNEGREVLGSNIVYRMGANRLAIQSGDLERALQTAGELDALHGAHYGILMRDGQLAEVYWLMGDFERSREHAKQAIALLTPEMTERAEDHRYLMSIARAYAFVGERERALECALAAIRAMPLSKDAKRAPFAVANLAYVHVILGEVDEAIDVLKPAMEMPARFVTRGTLRTHPGWQSIEDHPRFGELRDSYNLNLRDQYIQ